MPTYDYRCSKCGKRFQRIESISTHGRKRPVCPKCKSAKVEQLLAPFYAKTVKKS
jgi:putative FmdB family regulatory protein